MSRKKRCVSQKLLEAGYRTGFILKCKQIRKTLISKSVSFIHPLDPTQSLIRECMGPELYYRIEHSESVGIEWDHLAPKEDDAVRFACENINPEPKDRTSNNMWSPEYVLAHYGMMLNWRYRDYGIDPDHQYVSDLLSLHYSTRDHVIYRGVCVAVFKLMLENTSFLENVDLYEKGYMHCSLVKGCEIKNMIRLRIFVPKGSHLIYLGNVNKEPWWYEVAIQHGAKLRIVSKDDQYINCILLSTD